MAIEELRLSAFSLGGKDRMVMRSLLNLANGRSSSAQWELVESGDGDINVVDVDSEQGLADWQALLGRGAKVIAFTRDKSFAAPIVLAKPLRSRDFLKLLDRLASGAEAEEMVTPAESISSAPAPSSPASEVLVSADARPLADHLRRQTWLTPIVLTHVGWPMLLIDPGSGAWFYDGSISDLDPAEFAKPIPESAGVRLSSAELVERIRGHRQRPLSELKWFAGLAQMPGRLHPELRGDLQFMLAQIPGEAMQHERLHQLAQLLLRGPLNLADLVAQSGQPEVNVVAFLNACFASGKLLINRDWRAAGF
ncbi:MAG: hypothetical protein ACXIUM_12705 [Wenzhouxiangella sp.]